MSILFGRNEQAIIDLQSKIFIILNAIRVHHWLKNLLIFVPLIASHKFRQLELLDDGIIAFLAFSLTASAGYLVNDLLDLQADRQHPDKCKRPFASGALSATTGKLIIVALLGLAAFICLFLPKQFALILAVYLTTSLLYSLWLKREPILDVLMLGGLYTTRIIAGCSPISVRPSFWLLAFSMFFFLSLSLLKRYIELLKLNEGGHNEIQRRGYSITDMNLINIMGISSGYISVLVLALYVNSKEILVLYAHPHGFWALCLFNLYWLNRIWLLANRGLVHSDPVVFAITDRISLILCLLSAIVIVICNGGIRP